METFILKNKIKGAVIDYAKLWSDGEWKEKNGEHFLIEFVSM